jgi:hypothetical protein
MLDYRALYMSLNLSLYILKSTTLHIVNFWQ